MKTLSFYGWGHEDEGPDAADLRRAEGALRGFFGGAVLAPEPTPAPRLEDLALAPPRFALPAVLADLATAEPRERARHALGRSFRDLVRARAGDFRSAPDLVAFPKTEADVTALLDHCTAARIAVIPFGGGSSVCGGVEPEVGPAFTGTLSLDLSRLCRVLEVDRVSLAARIEAGAFGPQIEDALRPHGLTLRHYPQSFEFSTLGGWLATRSGGHYATLRTHIDDFVESLRICTPAGVVETRRLPGSGAGPAPERLWLGSEGALGVITQAWMRVTERPTFRASAVVTAPDFLSGARVVRALAQSGLNPSNCRLLDPLEAFIGRAGTGLEAVLLVAFESAHHPVDVDLARALECAQDAGGLVRKSTAGTTGITSTTGATDTSGLSGITTNGDNSRSALSDAEPDAAGAWKASFLRAPYLRDALVARGFVVETFETAITWERFQAFHEAVRAATLAAVGAECGMGVVSARLTHAYPDGAAPYYTVIAPARPGAAVAQWDAIKRAATDAILEHGGTVTHHHAVGRDLRPYYERERPDLFAAALTAAKHALDPAGILNPGVLLPPRG